MLFTHMYCWILPALPEFRYIGSVVVCGVVDTSDAPRRLIMSQQGAGGVLTFYH